MKYGINRASGNAVVTLDADRSTDPVEMHKFVETLLCGYDLAKDTRLIYGLLRVCLVIVGLKIVYR